MQKIGIFFAGTLGIALVAFAGCSSTIGGAGAGTTTHHSSSGGTAGSPASSSSSGTASSSSGTASSSSGTTSSSGGGPIDAGADFQCTGITTPAPSMGSCVSFMAGADAGELDGGLDMMGNGSATVCNPITNSGCTGTDSCFPDNSGKYFDCFAGDSPAALCADCTKANCTKGTMCVSVMGQTGAVCVAMCCADGDCGPGKCNKMAFNPALPSGVGICIP